MPLDRHERRSGRMDDTWNRVEIAGRPTDVHGPPANHRPRFGVPYLHDIVAGALRDRPAVTRFLGEQGLACVCPQAPDCWWGSRPGPGFEPPETPEQFLLGPVLDWFQERWGLAPR